MGTENILFCSGKLIKGVPFRSKKTQTERKQSKLRFMFQHFQKVQMSSFLPSSALLS